MIVTGLRFFRYEFFTVRDFCPKLMLVSSTDFFRAQAGLVRPDHFFAYSFFAAMYLFLLSLCVALFGDSH